MKNKQIKESVLNHFGYGKKRQTWDEHMSYEVKIIEKVVDLSLEKVLEIIPTTWLDSIFDELGWRPKYNFTPEDIERLCLRIKKKVQE